MKSKESLRELLFCIEMERRKLLKPYFDQIGLTQGQPRVLLCLSKKEHITQKELANMCLLDEATVSRALDRLCSQEFVVRVPHPSCRRSYLITLTDAGRQKANQVLNLFAGMEKILLKGFSDEEAELFKNMAVQIIGNLEENQGSIEI